MEHGREIAEHIAEEGRDHADEKRVLEDVSPLPVALFHGDHAVLQLSAQQRHEPDADHDADRHDERDRDVLLGRERRHAAEGQAHRALGVRRGDRLVGHGADHAQPQPRQRQAEVLRERDDADDDGHGRRDREDGGGRHRLFEPSHVHPEHPGAAQRLHEEKHRLRQHRRDDRAHEKEQDGAVRAELHSSLSFSLCFVILSYRKRMPGAMRAQKFSKSCPVLKTML